MQQYKYTPIKPELLTAVTDLLTFESPQHVKNVDFPSARKLRFFEAHMAINFSEE